MPFKRGEGSGPPFLADIICEQPLIFKALYDKEKNEERPGLSFFLVF